MPFPAFDNLSAFEPMEQYPLNQFEANLQGYLQEQHKDTGAHKDVTADSLVVAGIATFTNKWGINAAGDIWVGSVLRLAISGGTPTMAETVGGSTSSSIVGLDYAFQVNGTGGGGGGAGASEVTITFGHTFANAPIVVPVSAAAATTNVQLTSFSTTQAIITFTNAGAGGAYAYSFNVHVLGY